LPGLGGETVINRELLSRYAKRKTWEDEIKRKSRGGLFWLRWILGGCLLVLMVIDVWLDVKFPSGKTSWQVTNNLVVSVELKRNIALVVKLVGLAFATQWIPQVANWFKNPAEQYIGTAKIIAEEIGDKSGLADKERKQLVRTLKQEADQLEGVGGLPDKAHIAVRLFEVSRELAARVEQCLSNASATS
jgi:hypothetical protein